MGKLFSKSFPKKEKMKNVCLIFGGKSSEHEVSLISASAILSGIDREKYEVTLLGITKEGKWYVFEGDSAKIKDGSWVSDKENLTEVCLDQSFGEKVLKLADGRTIPVDVMYPAVHGENCEDGRLQGLFELADIPFVGPGSLASAVCMDKSVTKAILNGVDIPQARAFVVLDSHKKNHYADAFKWANEMDYPLFVKPTSAGSSVGSAKVSSESELAKALDSALAYGGKALIEEYIKAREIEVAVLGNDELKISVCGEIDPGFEFYDYDTKYKNDTASYYIPARISPETSEKVRSYAKKIFETLGCRGLSRVDFFVTEDEKIFFNEINTLPGFTSISMYPKLMMNEGMSFTELVTSLIEIAK